MEHACTPIMRIPLNSQCHGAWQSVLIEATSSYNCPTHAIFLTEWNSLDRPFRWVLDGYFENLEAGKGSWPEKTFRAPRGSGEWFLSPWSKFIIYHPNLFSSIHLVVLSTSLHWWSRTSNRERRASTPSREDAFHFWMQVKVAISFDSGFDRSIFTNGYFPLAAPQTTNPATKITTTSNLLPMVETTASTLTFVLSVIVYIQTSKQELAQLGSGSVV